MLEMVPYINMKLYHHLYYQRNAEPEFNLILFDYFDFDLLNNQIALNFLFYFIIIFLNFLQQVYFRNLLILK